MNELDHDVVGYCQLHELDVALAIASGEFPTLLRFHNGIYCALRISGTGVAWREAHQEFVYRDPQVWLSNEMRRRCLGLPVVIEHPEADLVDTRFCADRLVGWVVNAFVRDTELWGVARIIDPLAAEMIAGGVFDTSPGVMLGQGSATVDIEGTMMIVEAAPQLLDHVALVYTLFGNRGVWTRSGASGAPSVEDNIEPTETEKEI